MAAGKAAEAGAQVTLLEKTERLGKKLGITGKGRCNLTNTIDVKGFIENFPGNGHFLYGALYRFGNKELMSFFRTLGVDLKVERGMRVFPTSDTSKDILDALKDYIHSNSVNVSYLTRAKEIIVKDGAVKGVVTYDGRMFYGEAVILATGGSSYPGTGSTGDGYEIARQIGHTITPLRPSLVPLECEEDWVELVNGLSLKNVTLSVFYEDKLIDSEFGEMLFTNFGVSGPIVLTLSEKVSLILQNSISSVKLIINLKPALTPEELDARLQRDFTLFANRQFKNALDRLLPQSFIPVFLCLSQIPTDKKVNQITKEERRKLVTLLQGIPLTVKKARPLREAIVTAGGVSTQEINPKTMESRLVRGLFFAGEVIDIHGNTGGYNLQAAFSTGYLGGVNSAEYSLFSH